MAEKYGFKVQKEALKVCNQNALHYSLSHILRFNCLLLSYVRVKRQSQTFFVTCNPDHTIRYIKDQIAAATKDELAADQLRLLLPSKKGPKVLKDEDVLQALEIKTDAVLHMVQKISDNEWEPVDIFPDPITDKSS